MSKFEEYDTYVKNKSFLTSDNIITFTDTNGKLMALKPDVTLSIVKNTKDEEGYAKKVYYNENVYRVSGDSKAFKEIMQSGLECIGDVGAYEISEVIRVAQESLTLLADEYVLDVSHLGVISAAVEACGLSSSSRKQLLECFGKKNISDAEELLRSENVAQKDIDVIMQLMTCSGRPEEVLPSLEKIANDAMKPCIEELKTVLFGLDNSSVRIDFSVINDMRYYNGVVFQGFIKEVPKCILSGGQYDALLQKMRRKAKAIGFAIYLNELKEEEKKGPDVDVLVLFSEKSDVKVVAEKVRDLRAGGKRVIAQKTPPKDIGYVEIVRM